MDNTKLKTKANYYSEFADKIARLQSNIELIIKGKSDVIQLCLVGLIAKGHILIEDIPGVGKSTLAQSISSSLGLSFQRIQFTSDLLPSDILGLSVYDDKTKEFELRKGPIFANVILADEINRSTPKTQSALLEAMNDFQVTIDNQTHPLPNPFMVIATQNPVDHRGTFPLPESQLDRFMLRIEMGYPEMEFERNILRGNHYDRRQSSGLKAVLSCEELLQIQNFVEKISISESLETYILQIIHGTRNSELLALGASTRAALSLMQAVKSRALILGREYCLPDDIKSVAPSILAHRVVVENRFGNTRKTSNHAKDIIDEIISHIPVPV